MARDGVGTMTERAECVEYYGYSCQELIDLRKEVARLRKAIEDHLGWWDCREARDELRKALEPPAAQPRNDDFANSTGDLMEDLARDLRPPNAGGPFR